jgi:hypothetical protein
MAEIRQCPSDRLSCSLVSCQPAFAALLMVSKYWIWYKVVKQTFLSLRNFLANTEMECEGGD